MDSILSIFQVSRRTQIVSDIRTMHLSVNLHELERVVWSWCQAEYP